MNLRVITADARPQITSDAAMIHLVVTTVEAAEEGGAPSRAAPLGGQ